jgi:hypothetical protein
MFSVGLIGQLSTENGRDGRRRRGKDAKGWEIDGVRTEMTEITVFYIGMCRKSTESEHKMTGMCGKSTESVWDARCVSGSVGEYMRLT